MHHITLGEINHAADQHQMTHAQTLDALIALQVLCAAAIACLVITS